MNIGYVRKVFESYMIDDSSKKFEAIGYQTYIFFDLVSLFSNF